MAYVAAVLAVSSIHDPLWLAFALPLALALAGRQWLRLATRALLAIVVFNGVVSLSYAGLSVWQGTFSSRYLALLNLRVFLLTYLGFLLTTRVNLFQALAFSPTLSYLLALAYTQIHRLRRTFEDFRLALKSRTLGHLSHRDIYRHRASMGVWLLHKSLHDGREIGLAMRSRGFFDD